MLTDIGLKRILGTATNKDLKYVSYLNPKQVGDVHTDRKTSFDVYFEGENGEKFIVEVQNAYQIYFKNRSLFYSTFPIREQVAKATLLPLAIIENLRNS